MRTQILKAAALSATLLLGAASIPASALDVGIGGGGGSVASVSSGNVGGTNTGVSIGTGPGSLVSLGSDGSTSAAGVNLGGLTNSVTGLTGNVGGLGLGGGTTITPAKVGVQFAGMSGGQQARLRVRCANILGSPGAFDAELVALCRIIASTR
jgi:hypothetical protein